LQYFGICLLSALVSFGGISVCLVRLTQGFRGENSGDGSKQDEQRSGDSVGRVIANTQPL
jgi:hypothetical protein